MLTHVGEWLELKAWQLAVGALSALRPLGALRPVGGRVLRAAANAAQRASERAMDVEAQRALRAEYAAEDLYAEPSWNQPRLVARLAESWVVIAIVGWGLGLLIGLWLAGAL